MLITCEQVFTNKSAHFFSRSFIFKRKNLMKTSASKKRASSLPPPQRWLAGVLYKIRFGSVSVRVRDGAPQKQPAPEIVYTRKPGKRNAQIKGNPPEDFPLAEDTLGLLKDIEGLSGEWIVKIKVADGLPQQWETKAAAEPENHAVIQA